MGITSVLGWFADFTDLYLLTQFVKSFQDCSCLVLGVTGHRPTYSCSALSLQSSSGLCMESGEAVVFFSHLRLLSLS